MGKIVVIGGGEIRDLETLKLDRRIVELTGKNKPKALFIPTASGEPDGYIETFKRVYDEKLGCKTDVLYCLNRDPSRESLRKQILQSDLVYVGGGNTLRMLQRWRHLGIDTLLRQAHKQGTVLSGLSAGGGCWFDGVHSDSVSFYHPKNWQYIRVTGLGLIQGIHCPHFESSTMDKPRRTSFIEFMQKYGDMGIALDGCCAMEFVDDTYKVIPAQRGRKAYRVFKDGGKVKIEEIPITKEYQPLSQLYERD